MQDIKFPMSLDVFDLCTPELQQRLTPTRDRFKAEEDKRVEIAQTVMCCLIIAFTPGCTDHILTLTYDLQSQANYGHVPYRCKRSRSTVTRFK